MIENEVNVESDSLGFSCCQDHRRLQAAITAADAAGFTSTEAI